jgi:hypothetical protein
MYMIRLLPIVLIALIVSSCDVYDAEPRYDARDKVIGRYDVEEFSETYNQVTAYSIYVRKSGYNREIYIDNFYASNIRIYAYLDYDRITIPFQIVDGYEIEGAGTVYGSSLSMHYRVKDTFTNSYSDFCETDAWRY